jgi:hypothetical protein
MDQGLFAKHIRNIQERTNTKQIIIDILTEKTGVTLEESEITLKKKTVTLTTSSVKKAALIQKGGKEVLLSQGYSLQI